MIQIGLLLILTAVTVFVYRFNQSQIQQKKKMVESFMQQYSSMNDNSSENNTPDGLSEKDFNIYANIIGIYKHSTGKAPSKDDLFTCYSKIKENELSYAEISSELHKNKQFTCNDKVQKEQREEEKNELELMKTLKVKKDEDKDEVDDENIEKEEATGVYDTKQKIQYIINRPTIYNINNGDSKKHKMTTSKKKKPKLSENTPTPKASNTPEITDATSPETLSPTNRCDDDEVTALADLTHERNMNRLQFGCQNGKNRAHISKNFTNETQPSKKNKKDPKITGWSYTSPDLVGTSIDMAGNTSVGSILPKFTYKEQESSDLF